MTSTVGTATATPAGSDGPWQTGTRTTASTPHGPTAQVAVRPVPKGASLVQVQASTVTRGINAVPTLASGISGVVTDDLTGQPPRPRANVFLFQDGVTRRVRAGSDGHYSFDRVPPSKKGYHVCVFTTGDLDYSHYGECYGSKVGWIGGWPRTGRLVRTSVGSVTTGIDIGMGDSGHVTGTVGPASATGSRLAVRLYRADHRNLSVPAPAASVAADGSYTYYPAIAGDFVVCVSSTTRDEVGIEPTCGGNVPWDGPGSPAPEAATSVHVAEGGTATAPPITVRGGAAITGRVRHAKGVQGSGDYTQVDLYRNGYEIGTPRTANPGFRFNNLRPGRYLVCAHDYDQSNPTNPYSDGRCWRHVVWTGGPPPATATPVVAVRGQTTNGTFITLPSWPRPDGSIAGHILGIGAKYRTSFLVEAFDSRGRSIRESTVRANGSYRITGLPPTRRGYTVCAGLFNDAKALPDLADTCWRSVAYGDRYGPPRSAAAVAVASDKTHGGIDIRMRRGGAIAGRVTYHGKPVASQVVLLAPGRRVIARTHTRNAHYAFHNLSPSRKGYYICFDPDDARGFPRAARTGFNTQCYDRKPR